MINNIPKIEIAGGILASCIFLLAFFFTDFGWYSVLNGLSILIGWRTLLGTDLTVEEVYAGAKGLPPEVAGKIIQNALDNLTKLKHLAATLQDINQQKHIDQIREISQGIIHEVQIHPDKLFSASKFMQVYLDGIVSVGEKFTALKSHDTDKVKTFDEFLNQAKVVCVSQQKALTADDVLDLNSEITVLQRRMKAEIVRS